jgi:hypothetical protein
MAQDLPTLVLVLLSGSTAVAVAFAPRRRTLGRAELRRYRHALRERCAAEVHHPVTVGSGPAAPDAGIPLHLLDAQGGRRARAASALAGRRRALVMGPAGAGKTTLLRQIVLAWLDAAPLTGLRRCLPILLELRSLAGPDARLRAALAEQLHAAGAGRTERALRRALGRGRALLLLDGRSTRASPSRC